MDKEQTILQTKTHIAVSTKMVNLTVMDNTNGGLVPYTQVNSKKAKNTVKDNGLRKRLIRRATSIKVNTSMTRSTVKASSTGRVETII